MEPHHPLLLEDYPSRAGSPPAHITPFYGPPQYKQVRSTGDDGDHRGTILLAGEPVTGDRKNEHSPYDVPEAHVSSHSLYNPWEPQVAPPPAADVPSHQPPLRPTTATCAPPVYGGTTSCYADTMAEGGDFRSPPTSQPAASTSSRPPPLRIPSSSAPPPVLPIKQTSLYSFAVTAAETSQIKRRVQQQPPLSVSTPPMTAVTMPPPYIYPQSPPHTPPVPPLPSSHTPQ